MIPFLFPMYVPRVHYERSEHTPTKKPTPFDIWTPVVPHSMPTTFDWLHDKEHGEYLAKLFKRK